MQPEEESLLELVEAAGGWEAVTNRIVDWGWTRLDIAGCWIFAQGAGLMAGSLARMTQLQALGIRSDPPDQPKNTI